MACFKKQFVGLFALVIFLGIVPRVEAGFWEDARVVYYRASEGLIKLLGFDIEKLLVKGLGLQILRVEYHRYREGKEDRVFEHPRLSTALIQNFDESAKSEKLRGMIFAQVKLAGDSKDEAPRILRILWKPAYGSEKIPWFNPFKRWWQMVKKITTNRFILDFSEPVSVENLVKNRKLGFVIKTLKRDLDQIHRIELQTDGIEKLKKGKASTDIKLQLRAYSCSLPDSSWSHACRENPGLVLDGKFSGFAGFEKRRRGLKLLPKTGAGYEYELEGEFGGPNLPSERAAQ